ILNSTGSSGGLTVAGNGGTCTSVATCTGGTIQSASGASGAISLTSTSSVSLNKILVQKNTHYGIAGTSVNGFGLTDSQRLNNATANVNVEDGVTLTDTSGAVSFTNVTATGNRQSNVHLTTSNNSTARITTLAVVGGTYSNSPTDDGFLVDLHSTAALGSAPAIGAALFSGVTFPGNFAKGLQIQQNNNVAIVHGTPAPPAAAAAATPKGRE